MSLFSMILSTSTGVDFLVEKVLEQLKLMLQLKMLALMAIAIVAIAPLSTNELDSTMSQTFLKVNYWNFLLIIING